MTQPIDPTSLPGPAQKICAEGAPAKLQMMAAKGIVPGLRPDALVAVLVLLTQAPRHEVADQAKATLGKLPEPVLQGALGSPDLQPAVILALAERYKDDVSVLERLLTLPSLPIEAVELLAERGGEKTVELVATNEERMLAHPRLIELIYTNRAARMSTANRLVELAVRNDVELRGLAAWKEISQAIAGELIAEATEERLPEDEMYYEHTALAAELTTEDDEDVLEEDEEGNVSVKPDFRPLFQIWQEATVAEKVRMATLGTKEQRMLAIREQNKVIAGAAARSPLMKEPEVVLITRNRGVPDEVLRIIGTTGEWLKSYQVKRNLVENAKTPIAIASKLVVQLREADLRKLAKSKNVSGPVRMAARRHLDRRKT
ncbi:MAG: hypothetical protein AAF928_18275 [Myxococcota bacterium]